MADRILIIDDDVHLLAGLQRQLAEKFETETAQGGREGVAMVVEAEEREMPFAVVICDMRMPEMDGIQTLRRIHDVAPETVLLMLTGNTDQKTAIDAINNGHVHRFFTKPCPTEVLEGGLNEALARYRQTLSERDLLERTLAGSIKVLVDLVSINDPVTADLAMRIRDYVGRLSVGGVFPQRWQLKISSSLALIGQVALPPDLLRRKRSGGELTDDERSILAHAPEVARNLIVNIPRLGKVAEAVYLQDRGYDGSGFPADGPKGEDIPLDARIIKILKDLAEVAAEIGTADAQAFAELEARSTQYDPTLLAKIRACVESRDPASPPPAVELPNLVPSADAAPPDAAAAKPEAGQEMPGPVPAAVTRASRPSPDITKPVLRSERKGRRPLRRAGRRFGLIAIAVIAAIVLIGGGFLTWYLGHSSAPDAKPEQIAKLMDQMDAAASGAVASANVFGGELTVKKGTIEAGGVPRAACIQAAWQLARKGAVAINGVLAQRLTGAFIAKQCNSLNGNVLSWSPDSSN